MSTDSPARALYERQIGFVLAKDADGLIDRDDGRMIDGRRKEAERWLAKR